MRALRKYLGTLTKKDGLKGLEKAYEVLEIVRSCDLDCEEQYKTFDKSFLPLKDIGEELLDTGGSKGGRKGQRMIESYIKLEKCKGKDITKCLPKLKNSGPD